LVKALAFGPSCGVVAPRIAIVKGTKSIAAPPHHGKIGTGGGKRGATVI